MDGTSLHSQTCAYEKRVGGFLKLEWEGSDRGGEDKHTVHGCVLFVSRYHICEGIGPGIYTVTSERIKTCCQLFGDVVGMVKGMNDLSCSKSALLAASIASRTSATCR